MATNKVSGTQMPVQQNQQGFKNNTQAGKRNSDEQIFTQP
jgi:hypothetical protein